MNNRHCLWKNLHIVFFFNDFNQVYTVTNNCFNNFITFGCGLGDRRLARGPQQPGNVSVSDWP